MGCTEWLALLLGEASEGGSEEQEIDIIDMECNFEPCEFGDRDTADGRHAGTLGELAEIKRGRC